MKVAEPRYYGLYRKSGGAYRRVEKAYAYPVDMARQVWKDELLAGRGRACMIKPVPAVENARIREEREWTRTTINKGVLYPDVYNLGNTIKMLQDGVQWLIDDIEMDSRDPHPFVIQYRQMTDLQGVVQDDVFVHRSQ